MKVRARIVEMTTSITGSTATHMNISLEVESPSDELLIAMSQLFRSGEYFSVSLKDD